MNQEEFQKERRDGGRLYVKIENKVVSINVKRDAFVGLLNGSRTFDGVYCDPRWGEFTIGDIILLYEYVDETEKGHDYYYIHAEITGIMTDADFLGLLPSHAVLGLRLCLDKKVKLSVEHRVALGWAEKG